MRILKTVSGAVLSVLMAFVMLFAVNSVVDASTPSSLTSSRNTYLVKTSDGYMIFQGNNGKSYFVEYYDSDYNAVKTKTISMELTKFGGFFATESNYYILSGQDNDDESNSVECFRLTKYDTSWKRLSACSVKNCNTCSPFNNYNDKKFMGRTASFAISGSKLVVRTCHISYKCGDNNQNAQSNMVMLFDVSTMKLLDKMDELGCESQGYVSHSFAQYAKIADNHIIGADIGNAYPRGVMISYYKNDISSGKFNDGENDFCNYTVPFEFSSYLGDPEIKATLGGLETSGSGAIVAGTSIDQSNFKLGKTYNVFVCTASKTAESGSINWLTNNSEGSGSCTNVHLVKINSNKFAVIWQYAGNSIQYAFVDGSGKLLSKIYTEAGYVNTCDPIYDNGRVLIYIDDVGSDGPITDFGIIDASTGAFSISKKISISAANITGIPSKVTYTGSPIKPEITVKFGSETLVEGVDYEVSYKGNTNVTSSAEIYVTGKGKYSEKCRRTFQITPKSITAVTVKAISDQVYTGSAVTPPVTVTDGDVTLVKDTDYTVAYSNNKDKGTATVTITGKGNYNDTTEAQFKIVSSKDFTGWRYDSKGKKKYYYKDGVKVKGLQTIGGKKYFFDKTTCKIVTGWKTISKKKYYFNKSTCAATVNGKKIGKYYYLFNKSGVMQKSGWKDDTKGNTYYLKKDGKAYTKKWAKKKGKWYYFGSNGKMVKGKSLKIGKKTYKFKSNGVCKNP